MHKSILFYIIRQNYYFSDSKVVNIIWLVMISLEISVKLEELT